MTLKKRNTLTIVLLVVYLLLLTGIIIFKLPFYSPEVSEGLRVINLIPFQGSFNEEGHFLFSVVIYNVVFFIPLGVYICLLKSEWPFRKKILPIFGLTFTYEIVQFILAIGRTDITDILTNALGGIIGIGLYALLSKIFKDRTAKMVRIFAVVLTICAVAAFTYLFYLTHFVMGRPR